MQVLLYIAGGAGVFFDHMNELSKEKKTLAVSMLAEDSSIRAIERIIGVHRDTIMRLGVRFVAVLEIPPVESPQTAVKVAVVQEIKQKKKSL